jgi:hypothetical protein
LGNAYFPFHLEDFGIGSLPFPIFMPPLDQLVHFIAHERPGDEGLQISPEVRAAYATLFDRYRAAIEPVRERCDHDGSVTEVVGFVEDVSRTVFMIRAMARAIYERANQSAGPIHVVEGGSGSGLLAGVASLIHPRVKVLSVDSELERVEVGRVFAGSLPTRDAMTCRAQDLIENPDVGEVDVLIAEHIDCGLQSEWATGVPRIVGVDPDFCIPHSVVPVAFSDPRLRLYVVPGGDPLHAFYGFDDSLQVLKGREIVLADSQSDDDVVFEGSLSYPPGLSPFLVGNDIRWGSPRFGRASLYQQSQDYCAGRRDPNAWENHLMGFFLLDAGFPAAAQRHLSKAYMAVNNSSGDRQDMSFSLRYLCGMLEGEAPQTKVFTPDMEFVVRSSKVLADEVVECSDQDRYAVGA